MACNPLLPLIANECLQQPRMAPTCLLQSPVSLTTADWFRQAVLDVSAVHLGAREGCVWPIAIRRAANRPAEAAHVRLAPRHDAVDAKPALCWVQGLGGLSGAVGPNARVVRTQTSNPPKLPSQRRQPGQLDCALNRTLPTRPAGRYQQDVPCTPTAG